MRKYLLLILIATLLSSCEKDKDKTPDLSINPIYLDTDYFGKCFGTLHVDDTTGIIVETNTQYQALGDSCRMIWLNSVKCDTANLPEIDFTKYSLIGVLTTGGGCSVVNSYDIEIDTLAKKYIYYIHNKYGGDCMMMILSMNWALVPAIPKNYSVEFRKM
jgi:hypothetical protein